MEDTVTDFQPKRVIRADGETKICYTLEEIRDFIWEKEL